MRLYNIAKSIQPFLEKNKNLTPENIYKSLISDRNLAFLKDIIKPNDFPVLVFCAHEIYHGNDNPQIVEEIQNNIFLFSFYRFGNSENDYDCDECGGEGRLECGNCDGRGDVSCNECDEDYEENCDTCDGDGNVTCDTCDGEGESEDGETCDDCKGSGQVNCEECGGKGTVTCSSCSGEGSVPCEECEYGMVDCVECDGFGTIPFSNELPVTIEIFASFSPTLKNSLELNILRNTEDPDHSNMSDFILLLDVQEFTPKEDSEITEQIDLNFENKSYVGQILNSEDFNLRYSGNKITSPELWDVDERFHS